MIYFIILIFMMLAVYAYDYRGNRRSSMVAYIAFFVVLVVVAGLRYRLGTDSIVYEKYYENVPPLWQMAKFKFENTRFEPGFLIFASIPKIFSNDFMWVQFLHAAVVNAVIFWFIAKNTPHRFLCLLFYYLGLYFTLNMQVLREALAVCCFLLAWPALRDNKWIIYYAWTILATFFHTSASLLLLIPLFCLPGIREAFVFGKRTIFICIFILAVGIFVQSKFSSIFMFMAVTERMIDRVHVYSGSSYGSGMLNFNGVILSIAQLCLYPLVALYFLNKWYRLKYNVQKTSWREKFKRTRREEIEAKKEKKEENRKKREHSRWEMLIVLGTYLVIFSVPMFIFKRYYNYFGLFFMATTATWVFSEFIVKGKRYKLNPVYWLFLFIPYFWFSFNTFVSPASKEGTLKVYHIYYPYTTRLNPELDPDREAIYRYLDAR